VAVGAVPDFGNPDAVGVGRVFGHHVAEAAGHVTDAFQQDGGQRRTLSGLRPELADQSIHVAILPVMKTYRAGRTSAMPTEAGAVSTKPYCAYSLRASPSAIRLT
jgi:hypothetical protein